MFGIAQDVELDPADVGRDSHATAAAPPQPGDIDCDLVSRADRLHELIGRSTRELFALFVEIDRAGTWRDDGARDLTHWVQMRYGISAWKAHRWVEAGAALETLPEMARALEVGRLGPDKIVELTRFATPTTEDSLVGWAETMSAGAIRRRAELETRRPLEESSDVDRERRCRWWLTDEGRRLELMAELPAADGAIVVGAIEAAAAHLPEMPGEDRAATVGARRADALVALCAGTTVRGPARRSAGRIRPKIVVHAPAAAFRRVAGDMPNAELDDDGTTGLAGGVIDGPRWTASRATQRSSCSSVIRTASR